jgi:hypothetical protein
MIVGIGLFGAGLFDPAPSSGYPAGTPPTAPDPSWHRMLQDLFSTPVFTLLPAAWIVLARRFARSGQTAWSIYSALTAAMMVTFFVFASIALAQGPALVAFGGLFQRLTLGAGVVWLTLLAWYAIRHHR